MSSRYAWCSPEHFGDLTLRQVQAFLHLAGRGELVEFYNQLLSYGTIHGAKLVSLEEFLTLTSGEASEEPKGFDEKTDKLLEAEAMKRLAERRQANVK